MKCEKCGESFKIVGKISSCPWCGNEPTVEVKKTDPAAGKVFSFMKMGRRGRLFITETPELMRPPQVKAAVDKVFSTQDRIGNRGRLFMAETPKLTSDALTCALKTLYSQEAVARMAYGSGEAANDRNKISGLAAWFPGPLAGQANTQIEIRNAFMGNMHCKAPGHNGRLPASAPTGSDSFFGVNRSVDPPIAILGNSDLEPAACQHEFIPMFNSISCKKCGLDRDKIKIEH
jgi:hypothetical protein